MGLKKVMVVSLIIGSLLIAGCLTNSPVQHTVVPTSAPTSSGTCAVFVEGKYTTRVGDGGKTYATLETSGGGNAILTVSVSGVADIYTITYYPTISGDPCQGLYNWRGFVGGKPTSGNFGVVGKNPDKIWVYNDEAGNYDKLEMVRV